MQEWQLKHRQIPKEIYELKRKLNTKEFCKFHNISESKFSRFPSNKFIEELMLIDYMYQFYEYNTNKNDYCTTLSFKR